MFFRKIDDLLFDVKFGAQNISNEWQELTGLTNFWIAKWLVILWAILNTFSSIQNGVFSRDKWIVVMMWFITIWFFYLTEHKDKNWKNNGVANEERIIPVCLFLRTVLICFCVFELIGWGITGNSGALFPFIFYTAFFYFSACTPLPPSKSKVRKWYEKTLIKINKKLSESPEVAHV